MNCISFITTRLAPKVQLVSGYKWTHFCCSLDDSLEMLFLSCVHHSSPLSLERSYSNPNPICKDNGKYNQNMNAPDIWYLPSDIVAKETCVLFVKYSLKTSNGHSSMSDSCIKDEYLVTSPILLI